MAAVIDPPTSRGGLAPVSLRSRAVCLHCGTPFRPTAERPDYCCTGCQFVHDLIASNGLTQFYDLQESGLQPVKSLVFHQRDFTWLEELVAVVEKAPVAVLQLDLQGVSCLGCAWLIERLFARRAGGLEIRVDPTLGRLDLRWMPGVFDPIAFARELQSYGYLVGPLGKSAPANKSLIVRLGLCGALTMNTMLFTLPSYLGLAESSPYAPLFARCTLILATLSLLIGGSYFFLRSWRALRQRVLHIDLPISAGLLAAYAGSVYAYLRGTAEFMYFDFVSTFTFLMLVGRWLQEKAAERNRAQLLAAQGDPPPVHTFPDGERLPVQEIVAATRYTIEPRQVVPVRSTLKSEAALLGLEWINGESEAALAPHGRTVSAGAVNCGQMAIELEALEPWSDSLLRKLLHVVPPATARHERVERFIRRYLMVVLVVAATAFSAWWVRTGDLLAAVQVLISVLVVSCPCASGVALPLCSDLAASRLRKHGVFVRDPELWPRLQRVRKVVFDKTGTLSVDSISLRNPEALRQLTLRDRSALLTLVHDSPHPVSGCLREQLLADRDQRLEGADSPQETIGFGLELLHRGATYRLGRPEWAGAIDDDETSSSSADSVFTRDGVVLARFSFGEEARGDAAEEIATLKAQGCEVYILSGDRRAKVEAMANRLGLPEDRCLGELSPEQKAAWVAEADRRDTLYLGDGANDSLAFDKAWCTGTPAVDRGLLEQKAGFYFLGRGLSGVRALLEMSRRRTATAHSVVAFAMAYNAVAIGMCVMGKMNPLLAAVLMPASSAVSLGLVFFGLRSGKSA